MSHRTVFFVSDGTGITAETFGHAILAQFENKFRQVRLPFVDSVDKAHQAVREINHTGSMDGKKPIVFTTLVNMEVLKVITDNCQGMLLDMFGTFVHPLETELNLKSSHRIGRFSDASKSTEYKSRIEAINFSLAHDDGQSNSDLEHSDVILVGISRSGKTPTSLYLAMQYGLKASNYPLIPEDFERRQLPPALKEHQSKLFGLTIQPERLSEIRNERRPNSKYASLENCRFEVSEAEAMMRRSGIRWLSTTTKSIEEIAYPVVMAMDFHFLNEIFQSLTVFVLVAGCALYCLLRLAPNAFIDPLKWLLLRYPLPAFISSALQPSVVAGNCCSNCKACSLGSGSTRPVLWIDFPKPLDSP